MGHWIGGKSAPLAGQAIEEAPMSVSTTRTCRDTDCCEQCHGLTVPHDEVVDAEVTLDRLDVGERPTTIERTRTVFQRISDMGYRNAC
jgi:hypothetical protein